MISARLGWALPRVFAHRCGGALAPENTLSGLRLAARLGLRAVEFDVMLSADGSPWLIHDETLQRTTNGVGPVAGARDADLRRLDAGAARHPAFAGEALPTLADAARLCQQLGLRVNVEIKPASGFETETGETVARCVRELWPRPPWPLLSSFSARALSRARASAPELPIACLYERPPADWLARAEELAAVSLHCDAACLHDDVLRVAHERHIAVLCYTVNDPALATTLFRRGVAAVFTDRIDCIGEKQPL